MTRTKTKIILWMLVLLISFGLVNLAVEFFFYEGTWRNDKNNMVFTFKTERFINSPDQIEKYKYKYHNYGIGYRARSRKGTTFFVAIVLPMVLVLLTILFQPVILRKLEKLNN